MSTNKLFRTYLDSINYLSRPKIMALIHFWNWINAQKGKKREYTYDSCLEDVTDTLTLIDVEYSDNEFWAICKHGKYGKKEVKYHLHDSPFRRHWSKRNKDANSPACRALSNQ